MSIDHNSNCMSNALSAAQEIHIAMCLFPEGHRAHGNLIAAMHSVLIVAEEARQEMIDRPTREARIKRMATPFLSCAAGSDGECNDPRCPQNLEGEPAKSGRHCPLDNRDNEE